MEAYYILIVGVLFLLAISDLIVGVSNDAVNFLNSAIGSKAAPFKIILAIAAVGVLAGAVFSNGMMEVARKGIFNPEHFAFSEIMVIFLAVMLTDILLLDFFNTIGLPTSTTVSIVFEILGSAVAVSVYKITRADATFTNMGTFINIESSVMIIVGIFLSVAIAFTVGMIVQWIVRLAFSFNVRKTYKYWTGLWGGFAITAILYFLIAAGLIMVLTLRFSKKAKSVTATTIDLSRQGEGKERFASTSLARFLVRRAVQVSSVVEKITPPVVTRFIESRFDADKNQDDQQEKLSFDLIRASVNLVVASILIAIGTSLKLPLSTTYVTFMVAMGTSLADGAWGRESAVYRITGVVTVVGGWFFTAFSAFTAAFIIASLIFFGKLPVILILIALAIFILLRTHAFHKKRAEKQERIDSQIITASYEVLKSCDDEVKNSISKVSKVLYASYTNFFKEKHKELKKLRKESKQLSKEIKQIRQNIPDTLKKFEETELESGHHYVQVVAYMTEVCNSLMHIVQPAFNHLDNDHPLDKEQADSLKEFNEKTKEFLDYVIKILKNRSFDKLDELVVRRNEMIKMINNVLRNRIKILKKKQKGVKVSVTYMEMLSETKNLLLNVVKLVKADANLLDTFTNDGKEIEDELLD